MSLRKKTKNLWVAIAIVLFAGIGVYLTAYILAAPSNGLPRDNLARGLKYKGLKKANKGRCAGTFIVQSDDETSSNIACTHPDPGPVGVDVQARLKTINSELSAQLTKDRKRQPLKTNAPASADPTNNSKTTANEGITPANMNSVIPRNWPCVGTGFDGYRVKLFYAYPNGAPNNLSAFRPIFETIARRVNAVVYNSAVSSGDSNGMQVRFGTNNACVLTIQAVKINGDVDNFNNVLNQFKAAGLVKRTWKNLIWMDGGTKCGQGQIYNDDSPGQSNLNNGNSPGTIGIVWRGCWNYSEPHELMHMLGAVQNSAPRSTNSHHCYDENDKMCYDDGSGIPIKIICPTAQEIWRFDCNHNDYFDAAAPTGYLANHWNTAKSRFLIP